MQEKIIKIEKELESFLSDFQKEKLHNVLILHLENGGVNLEQEINYCELFICAKRVEGCSEKTIKYYKSVIEKMLGDLSISPKFITTENLRAYLGRYHTRNECSKVSIDNIRRILSSFFTWLENEDYILKSPMRRISKIRTGKVVRETYTDESLEILRDGCVHIRDLAMIDLLNSTGMRVGELVNLDIADINFDEKECIVLGKGGKERKVYFDARAKIHLEKYLKLRVDSNNALFVSLLKPHKRLKISGVEIRLRKLGKELNIQKVYPHKFRRTLATKAIDKGMPIEQVQSLLGHQNIDTTLRYAMVNQNNIKDSHKKYLG